MARLEDNQFGRKFLDGEFLNSGSENSGSRNNLEGENTLEERDGAGITGNISNPDRETIIKNITGSYEIGTGTFDGDPTTSTTFRLDGGSSNNLAVNKASEEEAKDDEKRDTSHLGIPKGTFGKYSNRSRVEY